MRPASGRAPWITEAGLVAPLSVPLKRALRRAVVDHARGERRRGHLPLLHLGTPGDQEVVHPIRPGEAGDHALRADVVAAMLGRLIPATWPLVWLTRPGELDLQDVDAQWLAAARQAYGESGVPLVFVVVNRHGWRDPRSGLSLSWSRFRPPPALSP
ncbi:hypothetical protein [Nocardioides sp.]|uniref:hypothetical protein n=1 Tax=Nocardioides sp. TaxID=35761 RepID=UPI0039E3D8F8